MTTADAAEFLAQLISQLLHADELITEQAERIEALKASIRTAASGRRRNPGGGRVSGSEGLWPDATRRRRSFGAPLSR